MAFDNTPMDIADCTPYYIVMFIVVLSVSMHLVAAIAESIKITKMDQRMAASANGSTMITGMPRRYTLAGMVSSLLSGLLFLALTYWLCVNDYHTGAWFVVVFLLFWPILLLFTLLALFGIFAVASASPIG